MIIYNEAFFQKKILGIIDQSDKIDLLLLDKDNYYITKEIRKKNGDIRILNCIKPESDLFLLQKQLVKYIFNDVPLPNTTYGFVSGGSYKKFLEIHKRSKESKFYLKLDIKNFFGSITKENLFQELEFLVNVNDNKLNDSIMEKILGIITLNNSLPQGAVTSPAVSNIFFRRIDQRIYKYCKKREVIYSRYADDLLFSTSNTKVFNDKNIIYFIKMIVKILKDFGLELNRKKIKKGVNQISLNGFVIDDTIRISRKRKYDLTKILFLYDKQSKPLIINEFIQEVQKQNFNYRIKDFSSKNDLFNYLAGYRAFLIDWFRTDETNQTKKNRKIIQRIETLLIELQN